MARALIVYGYYDETDHFGELLAGVKAQLIQGGIQEIDHSNTFSFTQKHLQNNEQDLSAPTAQWFRGHRTKENEALIKAEQDKVLAATHIIFLYPIWWESLPHYMSTWVSEVFRSVSFRVGAGGDINPQWIGDRKVMIISTAGFSQELRQENFEKQLPARSLALLKEKTPEEIIKFMELAQTYPLKTALQYSGLAFSEELHISDVKKVDEQVVAKVKAGVEKFIQSTLQEKPLEESPADVLQPAKVLVFSAKATQQTKAEQKPADNKQTPKSPRFLQKK
ncbi:MAG: NAD(P)H-dependent oxidoreductase [Candidatus Berkiella sp.]